MILEFRADRLVEREQLAGAVREAVGKEEGRMGRVERCRETGMVRVLLWVDVGAEVFGAGLGKEAEEEMGSPVPVYEVGDWEWPPAYNYEG